LQRLYFKYPKKVIKHNSSGSKSIAHRKPFVIVYIEVFQLKTDAIKRELYIKSLEGGTKIIEFLKNQNIIDQKEKLN